MTPKAPLIAADASQAWRRVAEWVAEWEAERREEDARRTPAEREAHLTARLAALSAHHARWRAENDDSDRGARRVASRGRGKSRRSLALIEAAAGVLVEIQPASVRAVCYRLFTMGLITAMTKSETDRVSTQLTWAREHGLIPWGWIVDETREPERVNAWEDPAAYVETVQRAYRRDRWSDQPEWIEVWSEKGTVRGTLAPVLRAYGLTLRVMHGYGSTTAVHQIAEETQRATKRLTVFYVGDWDPSGLHMSAIDLPTRLTRYDGAATIVRLALQEGDLAALPSFSAETKRNDPRFAWFRECYGSTCWELDALSPVILRDRLDRAIADRLDWEAWDRAAIAEAAERESLTSILSAWPSISGQAPKYLPGDPGGES